MSAEARKRKLVVAALIRDGGGQILLSRRRADQPMPLLWEFPGGKIEPGESPEAALVREVREELGCGVRVDRIFDVVFHAYADFDLLMLVYACTITDGVPTPVQVAEIAWVAPARVPTMELLPADFPLARKLAAAS